MGKLPEDAIMKIGHVTVEFTLDENLQQLPELTGRIAKLVDIAEVLDPQQVQQLESEIEAILNDLIRGTHEN